MRLQVIIVVLLLVAGAVFAVLNQSVVAESRTVQLPWGVVERPVVRDLLVASALALLVLLFLAWVDHWAQARSRGRLVGILAQRDQEITGLKGKAYDDVSQRLDALRQEISTQIAELRAVVEAGAPKGQA